MTTKKKPAAKPSDKREAGPAQLPEEERSKAAANLALRPSVNAAAVVSAYAKALGAKDSDIGALMDCLTEEVKDLWAGDMKRTEAMLYGQAHALQAIFMGLARRADSAEYVKNCETYLRMALKAQNQCRMTLETLATIKNPPVVIARQANINHGGQQQVNNGVAAPAGCCPPARAANSPAAPTELLEQQHGQRMDPGATGTASGIDSSVEAVGAVHRTPQR